MNNIKMEEKILSEINMTHKSLEEGVQHLIDWISKQPHLPNVTDEMFLKAFIVGSKSVERAKERLDKYFTARTKYPAIFKHKDPNKLKWDEISKCFKLPGLNSEYCNVTFCIIPQERELMEKFNYVETCKVFFMIYDKLYRTDPITSGQYIVLDCKGMTLEFVAKCITSYSYGVFDTYQNALPLRIKGMICFNASHAAEVFCNKVLKVFLSEKLKQRVFVHSEDQKILSNYFSLEMLPNDYGGSAPSVQQLLNALKKDLESERDWFINEGSVGSDELKRPKNENNLDHVEGTFRKLQLD